MVIMLKAVGLPAAPNRVLCVSGYLINADFLRGWEWEWECDCDCARTVLVLVLVSVGGM